MFRVSSSSWRNHHEALQFKVYQFLHELDETRNIRQSHSPAGGIAIGGNLNKNRQRGVTISRFLCIGDAAGL